MCRLPSETLVDEPTMSPVSREKTSHLIFTIRRYKYYICALVISILILTMMTIIILFFIPQRIYTVANNSTVNFITRAQWSALPSETTLLQLQEPSKVVIISHTAGRYCISFENCKQMVQLIQKYHLPVCDDIKYNFLIGADGNVYEGRGWGVKNSIMNNSVNVAFIGNYVYDIVSENMATALENLLKNGVKIKALSENYKLVGQNQVMNTDSPGRNVIKMIVNLPTYTPELLSSL